jgi:transposase
MKFQSVLPHSPTYLGSEALRGRITDHHRTLLMLHLDTIGALEHTLAELDATLGKALTPIQQRARLLITMPSQ